VGNPLQVSLAQESPVPLDVAFSCGSGEVLAIFGPSGSGKTTILRSIAGLCTPARARVASGEQVWVDTTSGTHVPTHRRHVGMMFQDYALFPHLSVTGNVMAALGQWPRGTRQRRADALLEQVHLTGFGERLPAALSGGERQRVALARALAREPRVLLLDEPFAALDPGVRRSLQDEIDRVRRNLDVPIVLVTHDFDDVVRLATHLLLLEHGHVAACGPVTTLTSRPELAALRRAVGLGSVFDAHVVDVDAARRLATLGFDGGRLLAPAGSLRAGASVRVRIPAREVILATSVPAGLSVQNTLAAQVAAIEDSQEDDHVLVQLAMGSTRLLAEITRDTRSRLAIEPGRALHALVKSVSIDVRPGLS
jgi:molybdate transport system ATP-binding protein